MDEEIGSQSGKEIKTEETTDKLLTSEYINK